MFRQLEAKDILELETMVNSEGIKLEKEEMFPANTYLWEDDGIIKGFFHFRFEHNIPCLRHFIIKKEYRSLKSALMLLREYFNLIKDFKFTILLANKSYLSKLIEWKFKKKPYDVKDDLASYLVGV